MSTSKLLYKCTIIYFPNKLLKTNEEAIYVKDGLIYNAKGKSQEQNSVYNIPSKTSSVFKKKVF